MKPPRPLDELEAQYLTERTLAHRLLAAPASERARIYGEVYDELFRLFPDHPQLGRDPAERTRQVDRKLRFVARFLSPDTCLMEIGAGDCVFSIRAATLVRSVIAIDVSSVIAPLAEPHDNMRVVLSDGTSIPVPTASVDVAYSDQLMEHLHPDDAMDQLKNIRRALRPGGLYICITPNRCTGPHDISRWFDEHASGFHLHEYGTADLGELFYNAGFRYLRYYSGGSGRYVPVPRRILELAESICGRLPRRIRHITAIGSSRWPSSV